MTENGGREERMESSGRKSDGEKRDGEAMLRVKSIERLSCMVKGATVCAGGEVTGG